MSTNAIPAPSTGPANQPDQNLPGGPATGLLSGLLTPVDPARATFDLTPTTPATPTTGTADTADTAVTHGSSDAYHGDNNSTQNDDKKTTQSRQEKESLVKAWLRAGATRWAKGGGVENKRLDLAKARATAQQVKETRQVTVNRSGGMLSGDKKSPGTGASGVKNSGGKGGQKTPPKGPKNSNGSVRQKPSGGPSGGGAKGPGGGRGPGGGGAPGGKSDGKHLRQPKRDGAKNSPSDVQGRRKGGATGGDKSSTGNDPASKGSTPGSGKTPASKDGGSGKPGKPSDTKSDQQKNDGKTPGKVRLEKTKRPGKNDPAGGGSTAGKDGPPSKGAGGKPGETGKDTKGTPATKDTGKTVKTKDGKPFSTQAARETGYRDGSRAAQAVAQVKAYSDGAADGWADQTEAAAREKERLDKAHQDRKNTRDKEQPVTTATSADYHPPVPIQVTGTTASHVLLGDNATRDSLTRGEVRTLKQFERRLEAKTTTMSKIAEGTKGLKAHADQQARKATQLYEAAKSVEGGEKLAAALVKLEDAAKTQSDKADEINRRAVRAEEGCTVVLANAGTRYGGMYTAVVNSDETAPAELAFYKGN